MDSITACDRLSIKIHIRYHCSQHSPRNLDDIAASGPAVSLIPAHCVRGTRHFWHRKLLRVVANRFHAQKQQLLKIGQTRPQTSWRIFPWNHLWSVKGAYLLRSYVQELTDSRRKLSLLVQTIVVQYVSSRWNHFVALELWSHNTWLHSESLSTWLSLQTTAFISVTCWHSLDYPDPNQTTYANKYSLSLLWRTIWKPKYKAIYIQRNSPHE